MRIVSQSKSEQSYQPVTSVSAVYSLWHSKSYNTFDSIKKERWIKL